MSGGGALGSTLATGLGAVLAPETFGASLLIPAGLGAAGGALGSAITGDSPLTGALTGGASGLAGGFLSGLMGGPDPGGISGLFGSSDPAAAATNLSAAEGATGSVGPTIANSAQTAAPDLSAANSLWNGTQSGSLNNLVAPAQSLVPAPSSVPLPTTDSPSSGSWLSKLLSPSVGDNPSGKAKSDSGGWGKYLAPAGIALGGISSLFPQGGNPINIGGNAESVKGTSPGFNAPLPKYNYNSAQTPYQGNWYTYGMRPQGAQVSNSLTPMKRGGLMAYAKGGDVDDGSRPPHKPLLPPLKDLTIADIANALPKGVIPYSSTVYQPEEADDSQSNGRPLYGGYAAGGRVQHFGGGGPVNSRPNYYGFQDNQYVPLSATINGANFTSDPNISGDGPNGNTISAWGDSAVATPNTPFLTGGFNGQSYNGPVYSQNGGAYNLFSPGSGGFASITPAAPAAPTSVPLTPPVANLNNIAPASSYEPNATAPSANFQYSPMQQPSMSPQAPQGGGMPPSAPFQMGGGGNTGMSFMQALGPALQGLNNGNSPANFPTVAEAMGHARGGMIRRFAMGGMQRPMMPSQARGAHMQRPKNPLHTAAQFALGHKIGAALRNHLQSKGTTPDGMVNGPGKGQDDAIPAKLSNSEYIIPADVVSKLGDGASSAGGKALDHMVHKVRAHKAVKGFPPRAKSPLAYIGKR